MFATLLATKSRVPPIRTRLVPRQRLVDRLNASLVHDLILISADSLGWALAELQEPERLQARPSYPTDFNAYLRIAGDGRVTVYSGKIEMGQGVVTSLAQMAADELAVSLDSIDMVMGDTALCPFDNGTYGSMSTRFFGPALRAAAAEAKAVLLTLASEHLSTPPEALRVEDGAVFAASDRKVRVTFGQLAKGQKILRRLEGKAVTKSVSEFRVMGRPEKRRDARAKVTGRAQYAGDVRLPGMDGMTVCQRIGQPKTLAGSAQLVLRARLAA